MSDEHSQDDQPPALEEMVAEVEREAERVGVDWAVAAKHLRGAAPRQERVAPDGRSSEVSIGLDVTLLLHTLRSLPTHAGTARFVAAMMNDESNP